MYSRTREMCDQSFTIDYCLVDIPDRYITQEMCDIAIQEDPANIEYIPDCYKSREMCSRAFEEDPANIEYIPDYFITEEMCRVSSGGYKKRNEQKAIIRRQLLPVASWHPDRYFDWCFDEEEKCDLKRLWGEL